MHAIIPVAGFGTRLRPHTYSQPKVLLNVAGKPILAHILDQIIADGITSATIVVGYLGDAIEKFVTENYPKLLVSFVEQAELLGLGHSIWVAREHIPTDGSPMFIVLGDTIFDADLKSVFNGKESAIGVFHVDDPRRFGVVETEGGYVSKLVEKPEHPKTNLMIAGLYFFRNPSLLKSCLEELVAKDIRTKNEYQLTDALQMMVDRGEKFATFPLTGWYDCGKPETLLSTNRAMLDKKSRTRSMPRTVITEPVFISDTADIEDAIIGPYATIGNGTRIRHSVIRDSIVGDSSSVDSLIAEGSIIGNNTVLRGTARHINIGDWSEIDFG
jgi:glucose-1-phosphate thymidylyltransferase